MPSAFWTRIAKALFATNPQVKEYLAQRAERSENFPSVLRKMWDRDEQGWKTAAIDRAREMHAVIQAATPRRSTKK